MRSIRLAVRSDGEIVVSAAKSVPVFIIERFVAQKQAWIEAQREKMRTRVRVAPVPSASEYKQYKQAALELVKERVAHFSAIYGFVPKRVSVGNARTRWGSCSRRGALMFSYRIVFLSPELRDYLIVHELCHLKEFNHSVRFWALVGKAIPHWKMLRRQLRMG
jgi:predicted metal-dependent hydrolase